jgi:hypothetical protein
MSCRIFALSLESVDERLDSVLGVIPGEWQTFKEGTSKIRGPVHKYNTILHPYLETHGI